MDNDPDNLLRTKAIKVTDFAQAKKAAEQLITLRKKLGGGAGLAANQAGLNLAMFIYTPDRTDANLRVVINPSFEPVGNEMVEGEEACYSEPLRCSTVKRWKTIRVRYQTLDGEWVEETLTGFPAKVFQHEMDHDDGVLLSDKDAKTIVFPDRQAFDDYFAGVKATDAKNYQK